jgi:hypothetical protein
MALGNLFVTLKLVANEFNDGIKNSQKEMKELEKAAKPLKQALTDIGTPMVAVGGAVTAAFIGMAVQAANYGDAIRDASIRTGVSTESLSGLKLAAEQTGTSFESVNAGLIKMSKAALAAADGSKQSAKAFEAIGVSVKDASGQLRPMDAILGDVAERFSKMKDGTEKAALAQQIFGRGAVVMTEFLNQGKAGLAAFQTQAEELNLVIGADAAAAADNFNDGLNLMKNAQLGLSNAVGEALLPTLTKLVEFVTGVIKEFGAFAGAHPGLISAVFGLAAALTGAGGLLLGLTAVLAILPSVAAGFALVGGAATAAIVGVAAVGAAIGVSIGMLTNWAIAGTKVETWLDGFTNQALKSFGFQWGSVSEAQELAAFTANATAKALTDQSSVTKTAAAVVKTQVDTVNDLIVAQMKAAKSAQANADAVAENTKRIQAEKIAYDQLIATLKVAGNTYEAGLAVERSLASVHVDLAAKGRTLKASLDAIGKTEILEPLPPNIGLFQMYKTMDLLNNSTVPGLKRQMESVAAPVNTIAINMKKVEDATEDVKRSAGKIFDDMFIKGENVFSSLANMLKGGALSLGRAIFEDIVGALLGPIKLAFDEFFQGLLEGVGLKKLFGGIGERLGGLLGGGGGVASVVPGAQSIPGIGGGGGGGLAGAASSISPMGLIQAGASIVGPIIGALITRGNAKRTEENTQETRDWLELQTIAWNPLFHEMVSWQKWIAEQVTVLGTHLLPGIEFWGTEIVNAIRAQSGFPANVNIPTVSVSAVGPRQLIIQRLEAPLTLSPQFNFSGTSITAIQVRDEIAPELLLDFELGVRGHGEKLAQIIAFRLQGLTGTAAAVGI